MAERFQMLHFYATREDLLPVLASVEDKLDVRYTLMDEYSSKDIDFFHQGRDLPTLSQPSPSESAANGPAYLVTLGAEPARPRELPAFDGRTRLVIDQLENPASTVLLHGGRYGKHVLLYGRVATTSRAPTALKLQRAFESAIRKSFVRIKAFYIGQAAAVLLDSGVRLTSAVQSPREYDLSRQ
jgi:hypothetical protein